MSCLRPSNVVGGIAEPNGVPMFVAEGRGGVKWLGLGIVLVMLPF